MSAALREVLASFGIEVDKEKNLEKGHHTVEGFKEELLEFGKTVAEAFGVIEIIRFGRELIEQANELHEASVALGLSAQQLQQLEFAASTAGLGVDELRSALARLNRVAAGSAEGKGQAAAFKKLGIDLKDSSGQAKTSGTLFEEAGIAIGKIENPTERAGVASEIFGRNYAKLLPLFKEGAEGFAEAKEEAEALGVAFDDAFIEGSHEITVNLTKLKGGLKGLAIQALAPLIPTLVDMSKGAVSLIKQFVEWERHTNLISAALLVFGGSALFKTIVGVVALAKKIGILKTGLGGLLRSALPLIAGFLALEDVLTFLSGGKSVTGDLIDRFFGKGTAEKVRELASLLGGDLKSAAKDIFAIFTSGKPLTEKFQDLYNYVKNQLRPQLVADFGEVGDSLANLVEAAGHVAEALNTVVASMKWISDHTIKPITDLKAKAAEQTQELNDAAAAGKPIATAEDIANARAQDPWYQRALQKLVGFDPSKAAPERVGQPVSHDTDYLRAPDVTQTNNITNNITVPAGTDTDAARNVGKAAADGTRSGVDLYGTVASIPQAG